MNSKLDIEPSLAVVRFSTNFYFTFTLKPDVVIKIIKQTPINKLTLLKELEHGDKLSIIY
ncbi:hypothetical protein CIK80_06175 [Psychrobacter sp. JB193]|nr:hypothetical protein CIK80_06175 [Psychrobacter sp. JB193]